MSPLLVSMSLERGAEPLNILFPVKASECDGYHFIDVWHFVDNLHKQIQQFNPDSQGPEQTPVLKRSGLRCRLSCIDQSCCGTVQKRQNKMAAMRPLNSTD